MYEQNQHNLQHQMWAKLFSTSSHTPTHIYNKWKKTNESILPRASFSSKSMLYLLVRWPSQFQIDEFASTMKKNRWQPRLQQRTIEVRNNFEIGRHPNKSQFFMLLLNKCTKGRMFKTNFTFHHLFNHYFSIREIRTFSFVTHIFGGSFKGIPSFDKITRPMKR